MWQAHFQNWIIILTIIRNLKIHLTLITTKTKKTSTDLKKTSFIVGMKILDLQFIKALYSKKIWVVKIIKDLPKAIIKQ